MPFALISLFVLSPDIWPNLPKFYCFIVEKKRLMLEMKTNVWWTFTVSTPGY